MIETTRRSFLNGLGVILAAPAVVTASSLMPVSAKKLIVPPRFVGIVFDYNNNDHWRVIKDGDVGWFKFDPIEDDIMRNPYLMRMQHSLDSNNANSLASAIAKFGKPWYMGADQGKS